MKRLGASCDWSRERFTLDPGLSRAVREAFVRLYEKGLIYRGEYMVNWCPRCQTAISDLETVARGNAGQPVAHPLSGEMAVGRYLVVATTRPGDHAGRYRGGDQSARTSAIPDLHGRTVHAAADGSRDPDHSRRNGRSRSSAPAW